MRLSEKAKRMVARARSMSDDEIEGYVRGVCEMPHLKRMYDYWAGVVSIGRREAFVMALFSFEDNNGYCRLRNGGINDLDVTYNPAAYDEYDKAPIISFTGGGL